MTCPGHDGWFWGNPCIILISGYERLIGGCRREVLHEPPAPPALAHALPEDVIHPERQEGSENWSEYSPRVLGQS